MFDKKRKKPILFVQLETLIMGTQKIVTVNDQWKEYHITEKC